MKKIKVFFSSVEADETFRIELRKRLVLLERQEYIDLKYEREISAGENWRKKTKESLDHAEIVLLLISPDYVASDFHYTEILEKVKQNLESGRSRVVPIHARPVSWNELPIRELWAVPKEQPISAWEDRDAAFLHVKEEIKSVIEGYAYQVEALPQGERDQLIKTRRQDAVCPMCGQLDIDREEQISLESFEELETGWAIGGKVKLHYHGLNRCCNCGTVFEDVRKIVPIKIPDSLLCPICDKKVAMKLSVKKVEKVSDDHFTFHAIWDCKFCNYFKPLAKGLKLIRDILNINVKREVIELGQ